MYRVFGVPKSGLSVEPHQWPPPVSACSEALRAAQGLKGAFAARGEDPQDHAIEIENEAGEVVLHLPFSVIFDGSIDTVVPHAQKIQSREEASFTDPY
jgi:hypothetical protein